MGSTPGSSSQTGHRLARRAAGYLIVVALSAVALFGLGELYLRIAYSDGLSFGNHFGPYVRRFEQDFRFNRFDGPSRGPEVNGPKREAGLRVLIQGDSITWGQGVKQESALFSSLLQDRLCAVRLNSEVAVLAYPGREIDGHLEQLTKWGPEIAPDVILYQWYINDIELDKTDRPTPRRTWQRFVFPGFVNDRSYLWYLLNYRVGTWWPAESYEDYIRQAYAPGTEKWRLFTEQFHLWAAEAERLTPDVMVILYPHMMPNGMELGEFYDRMQVLGQQEGVAVLDLREPLAAFHDNWTQTFASQFDSHPNAVVHERIAEVLFDRIRALWPELITPAPVTSQAPDAHV